MSQLEPMVAAAVEWAGESRALALTGLLVGIVFGFLAQRSPYLSGTGAAQESYQ